VFVHGIASRTMAGLVRAAESARGMRVDPAPDMTRGARS
jgi:hypothetical protein